MVVENGRITRGEITRDWHDRLECDNALTQEVKEFILLRGRE
jgi:hypothetical protein